MALKVALADVPGHRVTIDALSSDAMILCYCTCGEDFSREKTDETLSMEGALELVARVGAHFEDHGAIPNKDDPIYGLVQSFRKEKE